MHFQRDNFSCSLLGTSLRNFKFISPSAHTKLYPMMHTSRSSLNDNFQELKLKFVVFNDIISIYASYVYGGFAELFMLLILCMRIESESSKFMQCKNFKMPHTEPPSLFLSLSLSKYVHFLNKYKTTTTTLLLLLCPLALTKTQTEFAMIKT